MMVNGKVTGKGAMQRLPATHGLMATSLSSAARPTTTQYMVEVGLAQGTTFLVDGLRTSMLKRGNVQAAVATVVGATLLRAVAYGVAEVTANVIHNETTTGPKRQWTDGIGSAMVYGTRTGAISGLIIASANPLYNATARRLPTLSPIALSVFTSTVTGGLGSTVAAAINKDTWAEGTAHGMETVAALTAIGAVRGAIAGGVFKTMVQASPILKRAIGWMPIGRVE